MEPCGADRSMRGWMNSFSTGSNGLSEPSPPTSMAWPSGASRQLRRRPLQHVHRARRLDRPLRALDGRDDHTHEPPRGPI